MLFNLLWLQFCSWVLGIGKRGRGRDRERGGVWCDWFGVVNVNAFESA